MQIIESERGKLREVKGTAEYDSTVILSWNYNDSVSQNNSTVRRELVCCSSMGGGGGGRGGRGWITTLYESSTWLDLILLCRVVHSFLEFIYWQYSFQAGCCAFINYLLLAMAGSFWTKRIGTD